ncbi:ER lumen protein-retaining receptor 2 [Gracilinanus agilis]|uniref:ER lumen protein-retaining receptor 2 n=1 Tax=Gracilinanus agilis TaxID=191870 RepID=UPI001CFD0026|nr:ER lumen protein-retaining receptor 2 [Gracilinanus agilis]
MFPATDCGIITSNFYKKLQDGEPGETFALNLTVECPLRGGGLRRPGGGAQSRGGDRLSFPRLHWARRWLVGHVPGPRRSLISPFSPLSLGAATKPPPPPRPFPVPPAVAAPARSSPSALLAPAVAAMNIFRLTGDLSHLAAIIILLLKIWKTRSCAGISGKSQLLFALVFTTRYLDLFTSFISLYNTSMKVSQGACAARGQRSPGSLFRTPGEPWIRKPGGGGFRACVCVVPPVA